MCSSPTRPLGPGPSLHAQAVLRTRAQCMTDRFSRFRFFFSTHTHDPLTRFLQRKILNYTNTAEFNGNTPSRNFARGSLATVRRRGASTATRRCLCAGGTCAKGRRPAGLSRGPADAGPSIRRCLIKVKDARPWSGMAMRGLSAAERHLRATSAHPPTRCARRSTPASSQASLGTRRRPSGEGAALLWLLLLARTTCSHERPKHLSML